MSGLIFLSSPPFLLSVVAAVNSSAIEQVVSLSFALNQGSISYSFSPKFVHNNILGPGPVFNDMLILLILDLQVNGFRLAISRWAVFSASCVSRSSIWFIRSGRCIGWLKVNESGSSSCFL